MFYRSLDDARDDEWRLSRLFLFGLAADIQLMRAGDKFIIIFTGWAAILAFGAFVAIDKLNYGHGRGIPVAEARFMMRT